ncbi:uncharacterized protein N7483_012409 [Penicillium malachiteum]|uniref:uncharacterized protein n=1 Tax=Penicillium malachiteum TaxID=1324776 RepID=UPI0025496A2B|nr:uncharacterized protein N7483_012409 [Penicillium malachiteum]KAJ5715228.1 hypothetical protein N7483_012409 [Penicillium malachiteum]
MSFLKFRLENTSERSAPVPIAAAVSQPSSRRQNDGVQHALPGRFHGQASSDERLPISPSATHTGKGREHHMGAPKVDFTARRSRRLGIHQPDEIMNSKHSHPTAKDKCRRCLRQKEECIGYYSARPSPVEQSEKSSDSLSEGKAVGIAFNSETDPSTAFSMGFTETNLSESVKLVVLLLHPVAPRNAAD